MAKGNLILGTAKNSVGDVVMYRREGTQITRVRVRNVKNPKTNAQSFQRAIMAPIAKFYSPLSVILERSFEGLSKAKSHNKFNQVNANLARKNKWALPKGTGFFPLPYQLSQGTLPAISYESDGALAISIPGLSGETQTVGALSTALIAGGYKTGDVVTFIVVTASANGTINAQFVPASFQIEVDEKSTVTLQQAFGASIVYEVNAGKLVITQVGTLTVCAGAVIVSRFDGTMWRRSTQSLVVNPALIALVTADAQVAAAITSYGMSAGDGNPLVYLDGDELTDGQ